MRESGLLVQTRDDFDFLHQTMAEYLTATQIVNDKRRSRAYRRKMFGRLRGRAYSSDPGDSLKRFLIPAWLDHGEDLARELARVARDPRGARFVAVLTADGTALTKQVTHTAIRVLHTASSAPARGMYVGVVAATGHVRPAETLLNRQDPMSAYVALGRDPELFGAYCVGAARALFDRADPYGAEALAAVAADPGMHGVYRITAARLLVERGDSRGRELLADLAEGADPVEFIYRVEAATDLVEADDERGAAALRRLGLLPTDEAATPLRLAVSLARVGERLACDGRTEDALNPCG
jgi:hypothetical protein